MLAGAAPGLAASPFCGSTSVGDGNDAGTHYEWISRIAINGTAIAVPRQGYFDASGSSIASLNAGTSHPVEVDVDTNGQPWDEYVKIWLDLNQDGALDPIGEIVFESPMATIQNRGTFAGSLEVPANAYNGTMYGRVIMQWEASPALCGNYPFGATVDFRVDISGGQDNPNAPKPPENVTAVGGDGEAVVSFNPPSSGPSPIGYIVKSSPGDIEVQGSSSPITVPGLTNGTAYTFTVVSKIDATKLSGPSEPSNSVTPGVVTISLSPSDGVLPGGIVGTVYGGATLTASGGTAPYAYTVTGGALPTGMTLDPETGAISGTPSTAADYAFTVTATDMNDATGSADYSLAIGDMEPVANNGTATVAANSSANPIALDVTGGMATSVAIASAPGHGTATASGTTISYTPTAGYSGSDSFTYTATNATGTSAPATVTLTVTAPTLALAPATGTLPAGTAGSAYSQTVAASEGTAPYSYAVTSGSLPAGLSLDVATGVIAGTPTEHGAFTLTVTATDAYGATGSAGYSLSIAVPAPVADNVTAAVSANSTGNTITLDLSGGPAESVAIASAPGHGTATASGTTITYTPTAGYSGSDSFTYTATNATGTSAPATVTLTVTAPTLALAPATGTLPAGTAGSAYSQTVAASEGTAPYSYAVTSGSLPAGLSLDVATGVISGTPTEHGAFTLTVTATDAHGATGLADYSLAIGDMEPVANDGTATVAANSSANPIALDVTGGMATSVAIASGPSHGTATASGTTITYTPTAGYSGSDSFTYTATNATGTSGPATVTLTVTAPTLALVPASGALPAGTAGSAYSQTVAASEGTAPYSYAVTSGSLPAGLSLDVATGVIAGTLTEHGAVTLTITATDAYGATGSATYSLATGEMAPVANNGTATVAANSSANPIVLSLGGGAATSVAIASAPGHGTATASGTTITYTPTAGYSGSDSFTYTATNATGTSAPATVTLTVTAPTLVLAPATGTLPAGTAGSAYSQTVAASEGTAPYSYAVTSGSLPAGLSLDVATGVISGTPTEHGAFTLTVTATDAYGATGSAGYSLSIAVPAPVADNVTATVSANSTGNTITLDLSGGPAESVAIASAPGHGTATASGTTITYTPTAGYSGSDSFTYTATNATGTSDPATVTLTVTAPTLVLAPATGTWPAGTAGSAYSQTVAASEGTAPYSYAVTSGSLPAGLSLDVATGVISGTPTEHGAFTLIR